MSLSIYDNAAVGIQKGLERGEAKGYSGWDDPVDCPSELLRERLEFALEDGDHESVLTYAAMLYHREQAGTL